MKQLLTVLALLGCHFAHGDWQEFPHIKVRLIADHQQVEVGDTIRIGWQFQVEDGWHLYWQNPGDTGLAPVIDWGDDNIALGNGLLWAKPESIPLGPFINYGYHGDVLIAETFTAKTTALKFDASANWLVCKEACIPGEAKESLVIANGSTLLSTMHSRFDQLANNLPQAMPLLGSDIKIQADSINIILYAQNNIFSKAKSVKVFPITQNLIEYNQPANISWKNNVLRWQTKRSEYFTATPKTIELVVIIDEQYAYQFTLQG